MKKRKRDIVKDMSFGTGIKDYEHSLDQLLEQSKDKLHQATENANRARLAEERMIKKLGNQKEIENE